MSGISGPNLVTSGLVFAADAANQKSYRENLLTYSQAFTGWTLQNITATSQNNTAPDGVAGATLFTTTSSGYTPVYKEPITVVAGSTLTLSVYFRVGSSTTLQLTVGNGALTNNFRVIISNLTTTPTLVGANTGTATYTSSSITNVGDGWYRVSVTGIIDSSTTAARVDFPIATGLAVGSNIYLWGAQLNYGNAAAPYTPTTTAAVAKTLNDMSGNNNNSTTATITYNASGSGSLAYNGVDNYIYQSSFNNPPTTNFTISAWVLFTSVSPNKYIMSLGRDIGGASGGVALFAVGFASVSSGQLIFELGSGVGRVSSGIIPSLSTWYNIVATADGTNTKFYLNSILSNTSSQGSGSIASSPGLSIGSALSGATPPLATTYFHSGSISQVSIYNTALTATQVAQNFNATKTRYGL